MLRVKPCRVCGRPVRTVQPWTVRCSPCAKRRARAGGAAAHGDGIDPVAAPTLDDPEGGCPHPPGSEGKAARLALRAERGYRLFHRDDARG